jgi:uncharacterized protein
VTRLAYADSSALVKLVLEEAESPAMHRWFVEAERVATSRLAVVEVTRASRRYPHETTHRDRVLDDLEVLELSADIGRRAGDVQPPLLRTLDAVHLASALALGADLDAFVTYDGRLASAARALGLPVVQPA